MNKRKALRLQSKAAIQTGQIMPWVVGSLQQIAEALKVDLPPVPIEGEPVTEEAEAGKPRRTSKPRPPGGKPNQAKSKAKTEPAGSAPADGE